MTTEGCAVKKACASTTLAKEAHKDRAMGRLYLARDSIHPRSKWTTTWQWGGDGWEWDSFRTTETWGTWGRLMWLHSCEWTGKSWQCASKYLPRMYHWAHEIQNSKWNCYDYKTHIVLMTSWIKLTSVVTLRIVSMLKWCLRYIVLIKMYH
jgi:hypothetical protein